MNPPQPPTVEACTSCGGGSTTLILHNVRYRGSNRRYCTNCLLKTHQGLFCPLCFDVYDDPPPPHLRLMCLRCPSIAHRSCASPTDDSASFQCPSCADPNFTYFNLSAAKNRDSGSLDVRSAKVFVAATQIAALSMTKAAAAARFDAERRAKEAAVARKKAREALEQLASIVAKEQEEKEGLTEERRGVSAQKAGLRVKIQLQGVGVYMALGFLISLASFCGASLPRFVLIGIKTSTRLPGWELAARVEMQTLQCSIGTSTQSAHVDIMVAERGRLFRIQLPGTSHIRVRDSGVGFM